RGDGAGKGADRARPGAGKVVVADLEGGDQRRQRGRLAPRGERLRGGVAQRRRAVLVLHQGDEVAHRGLALLGAERGDGELLDVLEAGVAVGRDGGELRGGAGRLPADLLARRPAGGVEGDADQRAAHARLVDRAPGG